MVDAESADMSKLIPNQRNALRTNIVDHFGVEELKTLCFDLGVKFDNLAGEGLDAKVAALIVWFEERDRTFELIEKLRIADKTERLQAAV